MVQFYSKKYYESRVKARYEQEWKRVNKEWDDAQANGNPEDLRRPSARNVRNRVTKEMYEAESAEFRAELKVLAEEERKAALEAHNAKKKGPPTRTPEQFHQ